MSHWCQQRRQLILAASACLALTLIAVAERVAHGEENAAPEVPNICTPAECAIAAAKAQMAITDAGPAQFKAVALEDGYQVWVDHVAGYRRVLTLSSDFRVKSIGPKLPVVQRWYFRCCGTR